MAPYGIGHRIPVTREFDKQHIIGYLQLFSDVDIPYDGYFALGFTVLEEKNGHPTKIQVHEISLVVEPARKAQ